MFFEICFENDNNSTATEQHVELVNIFAIQCLGVNTMQDNHKTGLRTMHADGMWLKDMKCARSKKSGK